MVCNFLRYVTYVGATLRCMMLIVYLLSIYLGGRCVVLKSLAFYCFVDAFCVAAYLAMEIHNICNE